MQCGLPNQCSISFNFKVDAEPQSINHKIRGKKKNKTFFGVMAYQQCSRFALQVALKPLLRNRVCTALTLPPYIAQVHCGQRFTVQNPLSVTACTLRSSHLSAIVAHIRRPLPPPPKMKILFVKKFFLSISSTLFKVVFKKKSVFDHLKRMFFS